RDEAKEHESCTRIVSRREPGGGHGLRFVRQSKGEPGRSKMTEAEWLTSTDPVAMVRSLADATTSFRARWLGWIAGRPFAVSQRKWRLLAVAVVRRVADFLPATLRAWPIELIERAAEGLIDCDRLRSLTATILETHRLSRSLREATALAALRDALAGILPRDLDDVLNAASCAADPLLEMPRVAFEVARRAGRDNDEPRLQADL